MIRFANINDIESIMLFIEESWRHGHILGNNRKFFEYEHLLPEGVTYVISEDENNRINGILGYIPYGINERDIMTVMWKANQDTNSFLGLELFQFLKDNGNIRIIASVGCNPKLRGLYQYMGYIFEKMPQWYRLAPQKSYSVAIVNNDYIPKVENNSSFIPLNSWEDVLKCFDFDEYNKSIKPYKEAWYIKKRYFEHPIYNYDVYGVLGDSNKVELLVIFRVISVNGNNVVRMIDSIGNFRYLSLISMLVDYVIEKYEAEFADCYVAGVNEDYMIHSGWLKTEGSGNVIPNYYCPFVQENIDIYYFSSDPDIVVFKGDGDQDRPN